MGFKSNAKIGPNQPSSDEKTTQDETEELTSTEDTTPTPKESKKIEKSSDNTQSKNDNAQDPSSLSAPSTGEGMEQTIQQCMESINQMKRALDDLLERERGKIGRLLDQGEDKGKAKEEDKEEGKAQKDAAPLSESGENLEDTDASTPSSPAPKPG